MPGHRARLEYPELEKVFARARESGVSVALLPGGGLRVRSPNVPSSTFRTRDGRLSRKHLRRVIMDIRSRGVELEAEMIPPELRTDMLQDALNAVGSSVDECPHPEKLAFPDRFAAELFVSRQASVHGHEYANGGSRVYRCGCGRWHLASKRDRGSW